MGAHGSGKSTLLEHFVPMVAQVVWRRDALGNVVVDGEAVVGLATPRREPSRTTVTRRAFWMQLRKTEPQSLAIPWDQLSSDCLLVLDGYEQLSSWRRALVLLRTKRMQAGLLVTSHRRTMLPTLCELSVSLATARAVIERLTAECSGQLPIEDTALKRRLAERHGNLRDVLMDLYDEVEQRRAGRE